VEGDAAGNSAALEMVTGHALSYAADETIVGGCPVTQDPKILDKQCSTIKPVTPRSVILADFSRMMGEIDAANLLQEELIRTEPQLASAYSFMNIVSGGKPTNANKKGSGVEAERSPRAAIEDAGVVAGADVVANVTTEMPSGPSLRDVKFAERQRLTRITAAKSLLKEQLKKKNPSIASIATFRKEAYGEGGHQDGVDKADATVAKAGCDVGVIFEIVPLCTMISRETVIVPLEEVQCAEVKAETHGQNAMKISEDELMSIGESEEEEDESDGFSASERSTSGVETARSRGSRKRPADELPERDTPVTARRGFHGAVTRSEAGGRIHQPSAVRMPLAESDTAVALDAPIPSTTSDTAVALNAVIQSTTDEVTVALDATTQPTTVETTIAADVLTRFVAVEAATESGIAAIITRMGVRLTTSISAGIAMGENAVSPVAETTVATKVTVWDIPKEIISVPESSANVDIAADMEVTMGAVVEQDPVPPIVVRDLQMVVNPSGVLATTPVTTRNEIVVPASAPSPLAVEGWGRDALMVEGLFRIIENMEPPWVTLNVLEAAVLQFPTVDREVLRRSIMTIMMLQRRCIIRLTRAGLRLGPRTDREGNAFVKLDLDYADRYSNSH